MAYSRRSRYSRRSYSRSGYRSRPRYTARRRTARRSTSRRRTSSPRTVRIVIEQPGASLARPNIAAGVGAMTAPKPRVAKF